MTRYFKNVSSLLKLSFYLAPVYQKNQANDGTLFLKKTTLNRVHFDCLNVDETMFCNFQTTQEMQNTLQTSERVDLNGDG